MKEKIRKTIALVIISLLIIGNSYGQNDFTVTSSTDDTYDLLKPIKAGTSISFTVSVKNNLPVYAIVSVDTFAMGAVVAPWSKVDKRNEKITAGQTKTFKVTLTVPAGTNTYNYDFPLYLKAVDSSGTNRNFSYRTLTLIVDNSLPDAPAFQTTSKSTSITIYSWSSFDNESVSYSGLNGVGENGIEKYVVYLKKPDDNVVGGVDTIRATDSDPKKVNGLTSNTGYKAVVKAIDLAGNISAREMLATTAPAAPTGLTLSNTTYIAQGSHGIHLLVQQGTIFIK